MSTIPTSALADRLQQLDHDEFCSFVAALWSLAGWETSLDGSIVVARKDGREQRLFVLPAGRYARFRLEAPPAEEFDQVISARVEERSTSQYGELQTPLVDAGDLRHRLIYGCENDDAEELCSRSLGVSLRGEDWEESEPALAPAQFVMIAVSLLLVVGAIAVLMWGLPFLDGEEPPSQTTVLEDGFDAEIETEEPTQTRGQPTAIALEETVYAGAMNGSVVALEASTGEQIWERSVGNETGSPLVTGGSVYVRTDDGIHSLDAVTGAHQWTYSDVALGTLVRPTVADGTLYAGDGGELVALDAQTGELRWSTSPAEPVTGTPTVHGDAVYSASPLGVVYAFERNSGEQLWELDGTVSGYRSTPVSILHTRDPVDGQNESLLVTGENTITEVDARTGEEGWIFESRTHGSMSPPVAVNGASSLQTEGAVAEGETGTTVFVADVRAYLFALDPETGERIWTYETIATRLRDPVVGGPVENETAHSLYVVGSPPVREAETVLTAVNASTGVERWEYESTNETVQAPTVVNDTLYAGTDGGEVLALGTANGTERWRMEIADDRIVGAPTVTDNPAGGASVDSRVLVGLEGHHDWLTGTEHPNRVAESGNSVMEVSMPTEIAAGEQFEVRVALVNRGEKRDTNTVMVDPGWETDAPADVLSAEVDLAPGEAEEVTFSFTAPREPGEYTSEVLVGDEQTTVTTTVTERPRHEVVGVDDSDTVWQSDETEIIAAVRNTGDIEATTPIAFEFNGEIVETKQRTIGANETVSVTFSLSPAGLPAGTYNYSVATNDHVNSSALEVLAVDRREDAIPIVTQVLGLTLLFAGLVLGWRVVTDVRGPLFRRDERPSEN